MLFLFLYYYFSILHCPVPISIVHTHITTSIWIKLTFYKMYPSSTRHCCNLFQGRNSESVVMRRGISHSILLRFFSRLLRFLTQSSCKIISRIWLSGYNYKLKKKKNALLFLRLLYYTLENAIAVKKKIVRRE